MTRNLRLYTTLFTIVLSGAGLAAFTTPVNVVDDNVVIDDGEGDPSATCFNCTNGTGQGGVFCPLGEHDDWWWLSGNALTGTDHDGCSSGACSQHENRSGGLEVLASLKDAQQAVQSGSDATILRVLEERPDVRLAVDRSAIQVVDVAGRVAYHARIGQAQTSRLVAAMANLSVRAPR